MSLPGWLIIPRMSTRGEAVVVALHEILGHSGEAPHMGAVHIVAVTHVVAAVATAIVGVGAGAAAVDVEAAAVIADDAEVSAEARAEAGSTGVGAGVGARAGARAGVKVGVVERSEKQESGVEAAAKMLLVLHLSGNIWGGNLVAKIVDCVKWNIKCKHMVQMAELP